MDFIYCDYKCTYYSPSGAPEGGYQQKKIATSHRYQVDLNFEYHTTWATVYSADTEFESFDLGVDFSPPGNTSGKRCMNRLFLNFIIKGKGRINDEPFSAGQFYYTCPKEVHSIESDPEKPYVSAWISISGLYAQHIVNELKKKSSKRIINIDRSKEIMAITKTFLYSVNIGETSIPYLKSLIDIYLSYVTPNDEPNNSEIFLPEKIEKTIRRAKAYVRDNLSNATVTGMAELLHYNTKYLSRIFIQATGMTPFEYITDHRMKWAKDALAYSALSIAEITEAIGYDHRNGFTLAFKKKYGTTPSEYRKKARSEAEAKE